MFVPGTRTIEWLLATLMLALGPSPAGAEGLPRDLPAYDLDIQLDLDHHQAIVHQRVTWTNRHDCPTSEIVWNVHSHYQVPSNDVGLSAKMLELLRLKLSEALDLEGRVCQIHRVTVASALFPTQTFDLEQGPAGEGSAFPHYRPDNQTAFVVPLPRPVGRGDKVTVELDYVMRLPQKQGRWGQWKGVTFLSNWHPVVAYYDQKGWQPTPFIPWHQPFFNEAGSYSAHVTLPVNQKIACTGTILHETDLGDGCKRAEIVVACARDFALLCSERYCEFAGQAGPVQVRCLAFAEHEHHAREMVRIASESIAVYSRWFGPYPYPEFTLVESYFGWNGNECSGLVMIDERVFSMPHVAQGYVESLVSHETCHQWWYNTVGTNGYCETWMDEALANYFAHRLMTLKYGRKNTPLLTMPEQLKWLPNIDRESYRYSGLYGTIGRGEATITVQDMPKYQHLVTLFSMCYDKGGKIVGMIEDKLGEECFLDFFRRIYARYYFRIIRVADFQRELEEYTGRSWDEFFQHWLYGAGLTDWAVEKVKIQEMTPQPGQIRNWLCLARKSCRSTPCRVTVILHQKAEINEDTVLGICLDGSDSYQIRIPIHPHVQHLDVDDPPASVECLPDNRMRVEVLLPCRPTQIAVDPDQILVDREPTNNYWKPPVRWRLTPLYTMLNDTDLTTAYDRWNITFGPWLFGTAYDDPWYTRSMMAGLRLGVYRTQQFSGGVYAAYRTDYRDLAVGADGLWDHWPWSHTQVGFNAERSLMSLDDSHYNDRGVVFGRYVFNYGSSFYLPPMQYLEAFGAVQNNDLPVPRYPVPGAERFDHASALGVHYHMDYLTPYWDPEAGFRLDATYAFGIPIWGNHESFNRLSGQISAVKGLPDGLGWLSETRIAARLYGAVGLPDQGQYFSLGGGGLFRGFDLGERQGSMVWIGSVEWLYPIVTGLTWDCLDHALGLRNISGVMFYDAGNAYLRGHELGDIAHAVGGGLCFDVAWFSLVERTTIRLDVAQTLNAHSPPQFNFYFQHPF
jgi:hypothetical protein